MTCQPCKDVQVLDQRVSIERPKTSNAGLDGHVDLTDPANWELVEFRQCRFLSRGGREGRAYLQVRADVSHIIEFRSDPLTRAILPTWRFGMGETRKFNVVCSYDKDERKQSVWAQVIEAK